ncbi:hypothetical protein OSB04_013851 [Centaurea solstitialis]|uniref:BZIP domain-containing protein n=1 Tax=Centaurea solstitialis TaxID=347529 RepID=A0AA38WFE6_9ASTR|nr:hypothetical protein OSB04_013851 [Centaurea solstitialis]
MFFNKEINGGKMRTISDGILEGVNLSFWRYPRPHWVQTNPRQFWAEARLLKHAARGRSPRTSRMHPPGLELSLPILMRLRGRLLALTRSNMSSKGYNLMVDDEKKMKRMISNRESARRSRIKKEQHMKELNDQIFYLSRKKEEMVAKIERFVKGHAAMEMNNMVLRSQKVELEKRLEYAKSVVCGDEQHGVQVQDPWMQPNYSNSMPILIEIQKRTETNGIFSD